MMNIVSLDKTQIPQQLTQSQIFCDSGNYVLVLIIAFGWTFSLSANLLFLKSVIVTTSTTFAVYNDVLNKYLNSEYLIFIKALIFAQNQLHFQKICLVLGDKPYACIEYNQSTLCSFCNNMELSSIYRWFERLIKQADILVFDSDNFCAILCQISR